jgi:hypothetical protein
VPHNRFVSVDLLRGAGSAKLVRATFGGPTLHNAFLLFRPSPTERLKLPPGVQFTTCHSAVTARLNVQSLLTLVKVTGWVQRPIALSNDAFLATWGFCANSAPTLIETCCFSRRHCPLPTAHRPPPTMSSNATTPSYKQMKEEFVSNLSGGPVSEIAHVCAVAPVRPHARPKN